jgi:GcrA cell cycle regulator
MNWDYNTVKALRELWAQGHSATQIAAMLGTTKGSIVGKLDRLGLRAVHREVNPHNTRRMYQGLEPHAKRIRTKDGLPRVRVVVPIPEPPKEPEFIGPLNDIPDSGCRFPRGEMGKDYQCCGQENVSKASPYCEFHHSRCTPKKREVGIYSGKGKTGALGRLSGAWAA